MGICLRGRVARLLLSKMCMHARSLACLATLLLFACNSDSANEGSGSDSGGQSSTATATGGDTAPTGGDDSTSGGSSGGSTGPNTDTTTNATGGQGSTTDTTGGADETGSTSTGEGQEESSSSGGEDSSGVVDGVLEIGIIAHNDCTFTVEPSSITVPEGTEFTVNWVSHPASEVEFDIAKIDPFNHVPIVIGMEPGTSYHDDIRQWCGTLFTDTFDFRLTSCFDPLYIPVDCGG